MSTWTASFLAWLLVAPVASLASAMAAAGLTARLLTDERSYYPSQSPIESAGLSALFLAILLSLVFLAHVIWRVVNGRQSGAWDEVIRALMAHAAIVLLVVGLVVTSTFWNGQPAHGRVEGYDSAATWTAGKPNIKWS